MHLDADLPLVAPAPAETLHASGEAATAHALPNHLRTWLTTFHSVPHTQVATLSCLTASQSVLSPKQNRA
ncbi:hypothetical protein [Ktedonospora formicarum]|uniref:hypothetical protein n=1 Tax=Ktedonospora formicarum TaxID=2778364 RepID=UPI001C68ABA4|nr:hypothetical protein [Ktedonospora formicarum]